jgi:uncharacterized protein YndB with AHSA1/START domain
VQPTGCYDPRVPEERPDRVRREARLPVEPARVWSALTTGPDLSTWFGADVEIDPRSGGAVSARWPDGTERRATVEEVVPPERLSFRWAPFERTPDGQARLVRASRVEFELRETEGGTLVFVTEEALGSPLLAGAGR